MSATEKAKPEPRYRYRYKSERPENEGDKKMMACISQLSPKCMKTFLTTRNWRICHNCRDLVRFRAAGEI